MTDQNDTATARGTTPGRPASDRQVVVGALFIDSGLDHDGRQDHPPRARYECLRCRTIEGPVYGPGPVAAFVEHVRAVHSARCTAGQATEENHRD